MKSSLKGLQKKLWQLASRWLPPFYVPLKPGRRPRQIDYTRWPSLVFNIEGLLGKLWQLSFGWLDLFFLPAPRRDRHGRIVVEYLQPISLELPFTRQFATSALMVAIGLFGMFYFSFVYGRLPAVESSFNAPPAPTSSYDRQVGLRRSLPLTIKIPTIGVDAQTTELGLNEDGTMEVPRAYEVVGWYKLAPSPGEVGPAILVGHVDNYLGPAVFYRVGELKPGDKIIIERADGKTVKFAVRAVRQYPQNNFPSDKVYGQIDQPELRLITCGGQFDILRQRYSDNTVVYADIVKS